MSSKSSSSYFITREVIIGLVQIRVGNVTSWWTVKIFKNPAPVDLKGSIYFVKNIKTSYMFLLESIQRHNVATVVLKLFKIIKNKILLIQSGR